jgi:hypothetical protein
MLQNWKFLNSRKNSKAKTKKESVYLSKRNKNVIIFYKIGGQEGRTGPVAGGEVVTGGRWKGEEVGKGGGGWM